MFGRYVRQTRTGKLRLDNAKIKDDEFYDDHLSTEDVVLGYKQLFEVERVFRDMKHLIDIRPVRHRLPERIGAPVLLCWLGMLLIRVAEDETGQTWFQMKKHMATLRVGIHRSRAGDEMWQTGHVRSELREIMKRLEVDAPPRFLGFPKPQPE